MHYPGLVDQSFQADDFNHSSMMIAREVKRKGKKSKGHNLSGSNNQFNTKKACSPGNELLQKAHTYVTKKKEKSSVLARKAKQRRQTSQERAAQKVPEP
mmetsp:Transcript_37133/g.56990  ORF Transcript_37133/g.56990 Transcript_37133/m.56990 type:complete len:99 (+) Transcript_37133:449-745(+)